MLTTLRTSLSVAYLIILILVGLGLASSAAAATLSITPDTGVRSVGETFTARVVVATDGETINAADARIRFDPSQLEIVGVSNADSIFGLWTDEPAVVGNEVVFSGGAPSGYSGSNGTIVSLTVRVRAAGEGRLSFQSGSVLAADGRGSNVLATMNGATYTAQSQDASPEPEEIQYVAAADTPSAPAITSPTHTDPDGWSNRTEAELSWSVPGDITEVRTALTDSASSVPNDVADSVIDSITLDDLPHGVSYFHVQFRNADGWGNIGRYRLAVDTEDPAGVSVSLPETPDLTNPSQTLMIVVGETLAPPDRALVQIDGAEPEEYELTASSSAITLPELEPGYHTAVVEVFDAAGNSVIESISFTIESFSAPTFEKIPEQLSQGVIPVFRGHTRATSSVVAIVRDVANDTERSYEVKSDAEGEFEVIPEDALASGVYEITAYAVDATGARSERSDPLRFIVQTPGYFYIGSLVISILSVVVPTIALLVVLVLIGWYGVYRWRRLRGRVAIESAEAHQMLQSEFALLRQALDMQEGELRETRKTKRLTKAEETMISSLRDQLAASEARVEKEIVDVEVLGKKAADAKKSKDND